MTNYSSTNV